MDDILVAYSPEDECFVARVTEWSSLSAHGEDQESALAELRDVVEFCLVDMAKKKETPPEPIAKRKFSGKLLLRSACRRHHHLHVARELEKMREVVGA